MIAPVQQRDLLMLREAAQERNQEQVQFYAKRLLMALPYYYALAIVVDRLVAFLPRFEAVYPDEKWVRQHLLVINAYGTAPDDTIAEMAMQQSFEAPGMMNYLKAVYDLIESMQEKHTGEARIGFMTSALVNVVMAGLADAWYGERQEAWARVRQNSFDPATGQYTDPQATQIAYHFWIDEDTTKRDQTAWLTIAEQIEAALQRA
ncbi:hypothetical protein G4Y79_03435 [Phototrophicus methaneseepsis]|uniref:Uncharacterized protein n=1 Tax=Phototrophicus methaneseepsis TaxID=2710758 RepID=A0A7S8EAP2_9CHLR|nr:hypothetical protein [Phototrophicus methaneseepsis]QPC83447.1 hypothetical protein G4Y79_03435 [Phototrophicus methaneseepsis]